MFSYLLEVYWALNLWSSVLLCLCIFSFWAASDFQMISIQISLQQTNVNSRIQISNRIQKSKIKQTTLNIGISCTLSTLSEDVEKKLFNSLEKRRSQGRTQSSVRNNIYYLCNFGARCHVSLMQSKFKCQKS